MYEICLIINDKERKFVRNFPPTLANITDAMKIQRIEIQMINEEKSFFTDEQLDDREKRIADFAVKFWNNQFTADDVLNGADVKAVSIIQKAIEQALGVENTEAQGDTKPKKSQSKTLTKQ